MTAQIIDFPRAEESQDGLFDKKKIAAFSRALPPKYDRAFFSLLMRIRNGVEPNKAAALFRRDMRL